MSSQTAQKILQVSLELFNHHGEANITGMDIANELDISPGNLYYHFKGKAQIIAVLFALYHKRITKVRFTPDHHHFDAFFSFLYHHFSITHQFRFLYRNSCDLVDKYPALKKNFNQLLKTREQGFKQIFNHYATGGCLNLTPAQIEPLTELVSLVLTESTNYYQLQDQHSHSNDMIYRALAVIFFALTPHLLIAPQQLTELQSTINQRTLVSDRSAL